VVLALSTGMRHDEIRLLRWKQIELHNKTYQSGAARRTQAQAAPST
jgi:integrase